MGFKENLHACRELAGVSQRRLAADLGVSNGLIALYESGKRKPSFEMLCALGTYFHVPIGSLTADEAVDEKEVSAPLMIQLSLEEQRLLAVYRTAEPIWRQAAFDLLTAHPMSDEQRYGIPD